MPLTANLHKKSLCDTGYCYRMARKSLHRTWPHRPPDRSAKPAEPTLMPAHNVLRSLTTADITGHIALFHAVAHREFNAIDLALHLTSQFVD